MPVTKETLMEAQALVDKIIIDNCCGPILVRLAWHDSGTFDANITADWPAAGGAVGSIRFEPEISHGANAGLKIALDLLAPVMEKFPDVSYADIFQMGSARAIALAGGPIIDMKYGRVDVESADQCSKEGNLPDGEPTDGKYGGPGGTASTEDKTPEGHLRKVFHRMGLTDEDIVALSGAHTFGRAFKDRSGAGAEKTKFTDGCPQKLPDGSEAKYKAGGSCWTKNFLVFDNSYYKTTEASHKGCPEDGELLCLSTDKVIFADKDFLPFAEKFRDSQDAFFDSYKASHKKLSELGCKFEPAEGITL